MGRILFKKGERGIATTYMSRKQALKKLQLSLKDFRRLCILKGIYPVEPSHKKKANKNNSTNKTYYYLKDVQFLAHEPLIHKFRNFKVFVKRLKRAIGKHDSDASDRLRKNQPIFKLDHIVKERYPTCADALRDADDALSLCFLFAAFPKMRGVRPELTHLCRRLTAEFQHYVMATQSLRKVFVSIKGIYYQVEVMGQEITWIVPHTFGYAKPTEVDFKIMVTFVQFYSTMLGFLNYKLYHSINLVYPPKLAVEDSESKDLLKGEEDFTEYVAALNLPLKSMVENPTEEEVQLDEFPELGGGDEKMREWKQNEEKLNKLKKLFVGCKVFLNREVPKESLLFIIRCLGGEASFDRSAGVGATFDAADPSVTHHVVDRPLGDAQFLNRYYVQPQWAYDCVNAGVLLSPEAYFPGQVLPPHLSPFAASGDGDYVPPDALLLHDAQALRRRDELSEEEEEKEEDSEAEEEAHSSSEEIPQPKKRKAVEGSAVEEKKIKKHSKMSVLPGVPLKSDEEKVQQREAAEEKRLAALAMGKRERHLYDKIVFGQKRKKREVQKLKEKRQNYENQLKKAKKNSNVL